MQLDSSLLARVAEIRRRNAAEGEEERRQELHDIRMKFSSMRCEEDQNSRSRVLNILRDVTWMESRHSPLALRRISSKSHIVEDCVWTREKDGMSRVFEAEVIMPELLLYPAYFSSFQSVTAKWSLRKDEFFPLSAAALSDLCIKSFAAQVVHPAILLSAKLDTSGNSLPPILAKFYTDGTTSFTTIWSLNPSCTTSCNIVLAGEFPIQRASFTESWLRSLHMGSSHRLSFFLFSNERVKNAVHFSDFVTCN